MQKLRVDEAALPGHSCRLLMFGELSLHPRADSRAFTHVARRHGILVHAVGHPAGGYRPRLGDSALFDALEPVYTAALRSVGGRLAELDRGGVGRGVEREWFILGVSEWGFCGAEGLHTRRAVCSFFLSPRSSLGPHGFTLARFVGLIASLVPTQCPPSHCACALPAGAHQGAGAAGARLGLLPCRHPPLQRSHPPAQAPRSGPWCAHARGRSVSLRLGRRGGA
jgi:hypothetical protein